MGATVDITSLPVEEALNAVFEVERCITVLGVGRTVGDLLTVETNKVLEVPVLWLENIFSLDFG